MMAGQCSHIPFKLKYTKGWWFHAGLCCFTALIVTNTAMPVRGEDVPATRQTGRPIPFSQLGATAGAQYQGDNLSVVPAPEGARLRCVFQKLEGLATAEGLWLNSTVDAGKGDHFRVMAVSVGRADDGAPEGQQDNSPGQTSGASAALGTAAPDFFLPLLPRREERAGERRVSMRVEGWRRPVATWEIDSTPLEASQMPDNGLLPQTGTVEVAGKIARFFRAGLTEEYSVSADGLRQDFIILQPSGGEGKLRVELDVVGAKAESLSS